MMKTNPRHLEQQLAWRSLMMVALPALVLLPLLALSRHASPRAAAQAPLFTMAAEAPARAKGKPPLTPAAPAPELSISSIVNCLPRRSLGGYGYIPPTPLALQPIACSFEPSPPDDSDLTITALPSRQDRNSSLRADSSRRIAETTEASTSKIVHRTSYIVHSPRPPYPESLRRRRITGSVGVRIAVSAQGLPSAVDITRSSGHAEFDSTTRSWILRHWRFQPATSGGRAIASSVTTTVHFRLL